MQPHDDSVRLHVSKAIEDTTLDGRAVSCRDIIGAVLAATGAAAFGATAGAQETLPARQPQANSLRGSPIVYNMKKSINQWAFPYPQRMTLEDCLLLAKRAGFDGIELNYDLENDLSPKSGAKEYRAIRRMAEAIGIQISGLCSFLFWPYPLTSNDPAKRARGLELAGLMAEAAYELGVENLLVVPGAVHIPWRTDHEPVPNDICDQRARAAIGSLVKQAEKLKVSLNIENIFFNGYLMTPMEMNDFVDSFQSENVPHPFRHRQYRDLPISRTLGADHGRTNQEHPFQGVHQERHGLLARNISSAVGRYDELARCYGIAR